MTAISVVLGHVDEVVLGWVQEPQTPVGAGLSVGMWASYRSQVAGVRCAPLRGAHWRTGAATVAPTPTEEVSAGTRAKRHAVRGGSPHTESHE